MAVNRPVQVFTELKNLQKPSKSFVITENMNALNSKDTVNITALDRQINVTGVGEMALPPNRFSVTIKCKAVKETVQDAKFSVTRRLDYIIQSLKNVNLKEDDYKVYQHVNYQDSAAVYESEVEAHFLEIEKCLNVSNLLVEKLGSGISVSLPLCYHAAGSLDKLRKQVGMLAIHNARQKAMEMAKVIHLSVGPAVQVQEESFSELSGTKDYDIEDFDLNTAGIQQRISERTVRITSKVNVMFQLKSSRKKKMEG